jgi:hypothetical protein
VSIDISPADTGEIRRDTGEQTVAIQLADTEPVMPRRPDAWPIIEHTGPERPFGLVFDTTGEPPLVIAPEDRQAVIDAVTEPVTLLPVVEPPKARQPRRYVGRHRAAEDAELIALDVSTALWPRLIGRLLRRKAGAR